MISIILSSGRISISMTPKFWRKTWDEWDVHLVILSSLSLQIILIFTASSRKRSKGFLLRFIWSAYLLADWAASYCIGLISNNQNDHSTKTQRDHLFAFWSPFLLLHLGGPDTITAYALEDNELWLRHLMALIFQSGMTAYIFVLTVHGNSLWLPTLLVFVAGLIKYAERTRALYIASFDAFRQSLVPDPGPDYGRLMEQLYSRRRAGLPAQIVTIPETETKRTRDNVSNQGWSQEQNDQLEAVRKGFFFFQKFKGIIVDMIYSFGDRRESRQYFGDKTSEQVLQVLEIELNFMYEAFYTKVMIVRKKFGYWCKFVSFTSVMLALVLFILEEKHGLHKFDIGVTYALLYGALALDTIAFFMLFVTDYTATSSQESLDSNEYYCRFQRIKMPLLKWFNEKILVRVLGKKGPKWEEIEGDDDPYKGYERLSTSALYRRWFGSISRYNLMKYCLEMSVEKIPHNLNKNDRIARFQQECFKVVLSVQGGFYKVAQFCGIGGFIDQWRFMDKTPLFRELWKYIFHVLKDRSNEVWEEDAEMIRSMCCMRGEWVMRGKNQDDGGGLKPFVDSTEVAFDQSLIMWHIATCLCYYSENNDGEDGGERMERDFSMILSDYLIYLLIVQPTMMSSVAGIGQIRFQTTCEEAKRFFSRRSLEQISDRTKRLEKACQDIMEVLKDVAPEDLKREWSISLLFDACRLAKELNKLQKNKWGIIAAVWVELLSFAAFQCRASEGGELLSLVWLLVFHLGLGNFQFKDPKTKLLIGKVL